MPTHQQYAISEVRTGLIGLPDSEFETGLMTTLFVEFKLYSLNLSAVSPTVSVSAFQLDLLKLQGAPQKSGHSLLFQKKIHKKIIY
jgi:hypothetical protein